jgi:hypothetical protein
MSAQPSWTLKRRMRTIYLPVSLALSLLIWVFLPMPFAVSWFEIVIEFFLFWLVVIVLVRNFARRTEEDRKGTSAQF